MKLPIQFIYHCMTRKMRQCLSDKTFIQCQYREVTGHDIDWENPRGFNEKMCWGKLYDRNPLLTNCADKYAVREYVKARGYPEIINELYGVYNNAAEIDSASFPSSCVLRATHGSGWNVIIKEGAVFIAKRQRNIKTAKRRLKIWLEKSQYIRYREWCYKNIVPRIVCEKLLQNADGSLHDYKIHCFHGKPLVIQNIVDRASKPSEAFYDSNWNKLDLISLTYPPCKRLLTKPALLSRMLEIAAALSADFYYVRVGLYEYNGEPIFGEMSFNPGGGGLRFSPPKWDIKFGEWLNLSLKK